MGPHGQQSDGLGERGYLGGRNEPGFILEGDGTNGIIIQDGGGSAIHNY